VASGSRTAVVGPSGCGKTTLLRLIAGFDRPDGGSIAFDGSPIADQMSQIPAHRRGVGIVSQDGSLFPHLTVGQNIGFGLKVEADIRRARIAELMEMVGLERDMAARRPDQLSGGQQQRVALARAMAPRPRLMLLDEPFSALDTGLRAATRKSVGAVLAQAGITTILVTHDQAEALAFADQLVVMRGGRFAQVGSPRDVYTRPRDAITAAFLGEAIVVFGMVADGRADTPLGRFAVDDRDRSGGVNILLRPEQLSITPADEPQSAFGPPGGAVSGTVTDIDFCGASCELGLFVSEGDYSFRMTTPTRALLSPGDRVIIRVEGIGHVLA